MASCFAARHKDRAAKLEAKSGRATRGHPSRQNTFRGQYKRLLKKLFLIEA